MAATTESVRADAAAATYTSQDWVPAQIQSPHLTIGETNHADR